MKFIIGGLSFLVALFSCNSAVEKKPAAKENELIRQFKPFLHGVWVQADYMDNIAETKSPYKSSKKLKFITLFTIDTSAISAGSVMAGAELGNHEGGRFILYFRQGETKISLPTNISEPEEDISTCELSYELNNDDTAL
jgi:hypothetical protein